MSLRTDMRIVFVGDQNVGKSTLINSIISDSFQERVMHVVPEVTIPPEVTLDKVATHIIDTAADTPQHKANLELEIKRASVIVLLYAIDRLSSVVNVRSHWLPYIRELRQNVDSQNYNVVPPIILVGSKADSRGFESYPVQHEDQIDEMVNQIMLDNKEMETWVECSAKQSQNVQDVFFYAQKAVMYPQGVIYDVKAKSLTPQCKEALGRIFMLCDLDGDEVLSDDELNEFQQRCFHVMLQEDELNDIKSVVQASTESGVRNNGLTKEGFIYLHLLFVMKGRLETAWTVLRQYGYDDSLHLSSSFLAPPLPHGAPAHGNTTELSDKGLAYFRTLFNRFDKDEDRALNKDEMTRLFQTSPGIPWDKGLFPAFAITTATGNALTQHGFLALWQLTTLLDYNTTLRYLAFLGYGGEDAPAAIKVTRGRRQDQKARSISRNVFQCFVFGTQGSGKTHLLRGVLGKASDEDVKEDFAQDRCAINSVDVNHPDKWLVLREFVDEAGTLQTRDTMEQCDLAVLIYDHTNKSSLSTLINTHAILHKMDPSLPTVFVSSKPDLTPAVVQDAPRITPQAYFTQWNLVPQYSLNLRRPVSPEFYSGLLTTIIKSHNGPIAISGSGKWGRRILGGVAFLVVVGGFAFVGRFVWKQLQK
eukprot:TRINITY_DN9705_c0_g1_i4.p1 TRINITY_DN9705_c0_g1~~TRINITY_DN9705_c0_g1_i4.p1  ORF type:complete len:646 (+),score=129.20 TRINITY_DN9705_c0_g1_i4:85-2022(+)